VQGDGLLDFGLRELLAIGAVDGLAVGLDVGSVWQREMSLSAIRSAQEQRDDHASRVAKRRVGGCWHPHATRAPPSPR
jgi:hypothetical protein